MVTNTSTVIEGHKVAVGSAPELQAMWFSFYIVSILIIYSSKNDLLSKIHVICQGP